MLRFVAAAMLCLAMGAEAAVTIEKTAYQGWNNCYRVTNGEVELIVTADVGPRVIRYAFVGGTNLFKEFAAELGHSGEADWKPRGGHRVWVAPELTDVTYAPDNGPIEVKTAFDTLEAIQPVEKSTGLQKSMVIRMAPKGTAVEVLHRVTNTWDKARHLAPWTLTMMTPGGIGITGFPPRGTHPEMLLPTNPLIMWAFTDLTDPRWTFTRKYLLLRQDPKAKTPQKLGTFNPETWGAYLLGSELFLKRSKADPSKTYADFGASFETFTNAEILELETLGPLVWLEKGQTIEHTEQWSLHRGIKLPKLDDATLDKVIGPLVR